ncbi:hypothetical protein [Streptacidiphilus sp. PAMC 29251]
MELSWPDIAAGHRRRTSPPNLVMDIVLGGGASCAPLLGAAMVH